MSYGASVILKAVELALHKNQRACVMLARYLNLVFIDLISF